MDSQSRHVNDKINVLCSEGKIFALKELMESNNFDFIANDFDIAAGNGHTNVLDLIVKSNKKFDYTVFAINEACKNDHVCVLKWFKKSGLEIKYDANAFINASKFGNVDILRRFEKYGWKFIYHAAAINEASGEDQLEVLMWWKDHINKNSDLKKMIHDSHYEVVSCDYEQLQVTEQNGQKIYSIEINGTTYFSDSNIFIVTFDDENRVYTEKAIEFAINKNALKSLTWWLKYAKLRLLLPDNLESLIEKTNNAQIITWYCKLTESQTIGMLKRMGLLDKTRTFKDVLALNLQLKFIK